LAKKGPAIANADVAIPDVNGRLSGKRIYNAGNPHIDPSRYNLDVYLVRACSRA